ncbi:hypothetical protein ACTJJ7_03625 [Phyllobacterium sp. 22229]|uniref:hypothetical protein n=1 Tax=Phyllobacterium sp. 22229 TaxID=3453895 RepID=UPI003F82D722
MRFLLAFSTLVFCVFLLSNAFAQADDPQKLMQFAIVREDSHQCEPICPEWIYAYGSIGTTTPKEFEKVISQMGDRRLPIIIESPGGDMKAGLEMGRLVRKNGLDIAVGRVQFKACRPEDQTCKPIYTNPTAYAGSAVPDYAYCSSACVFVVAGGLKRLGGRKEFGVHRPFVPGHPPETGPSPVKSMLANFFSEMGVDPGIVDIALSSHQIIHLPRQKAQDLHLTTGMGNLYELMGVRLCTQDPLRKNCVVSNVHAMQ